ncbi:MAG: flagellar M-ring protein FliF [Proteobacteria bacterium]|nr:flagellar M-ring protein FliF [Pseudomonadota bacterium]
MAESALETNSQALAPARAQDTTRISQPQSGRSLPSQTVSGETVPIIRTILEQPGVQKTLPAIVVLFGLATLAFIYSYVSAPAARPIFPDLTESDRQVAYDALLTAGNFGAYLDQNTGQLMVPENEYFDAKLFLASQNIPRSASSGGFEELLANDSMTRSRSMEAAQLKEFDERELKETIEAIYSIKSARVQIARPQQSVFVRDKEPAKASVYVEPYGGRIISPSNIQAIVHLVSSSVPFLPPENVAVISNSGMLLTAKLDENSSLQAASKQIEQKQSMEADYRNRIEQIMSRFVGFDKVRSEVDIALNFTQVETTYEDFDKEGTGGLTRSEIVNIDEQESVSGDSGPPAGTFVQAPELTDESEGENSKQLSSSTTKNYELDREIRYVKSQIGVIDRLTVSVAFDRNEFLRTNGSPLADGSMPTELTGQQLSNLESLIKSAIGFDEIRGDVVTLVPMVFFQPELEEPEPETFWDAAEGWFNDPTIRYLLQMTIASILVILALFALVRPALKFYMTGAGSRASSVGSGISGELSPQEVALLRQGDAGALQDIKTKLMPKRSSIPEDMLDTANTYDEKIALMKMISADDPGRVANLVKRMLNA